MNNLRDTRAGEPGKLASLLREIWQGKRYLFHSTKYIDAPLRGYKKESFRIRWYSQEPCIHNK